MIEINLLPEERKIKKVKKSADLTVAMKFLPYAVGGVLLINVLLLSLAGIKNIQLSVLNGKWKKLQPQRETVQQFTQGFQTATKDAQVFQKINQQNLSWQKKLNALSLYLPSGVWYNELSVTDNSFMLKGSAISVEKQEMTLIGALIDALKKDQDFYRDFASLELNSVSKRYIGAYEIVDFVLTGTLK